MTPDEQEIRQLVVTWLEATKKGDIPTVLGLMAEDVVFLVPGQPPMIGRDSFAAAQSNLGKDAVAIFALRRFGKVLVKLRQRGRIVVTHIASGQEI